MSFHVKYPSEVQEGVGLNVRRGTNFTFFIPCTSQSNTFLGVILILFSIFFNAVLAGEA